MSLKSKNEQITHELSDKENNLMTKYEQKQQLLVKQSKVNERLLINMIRMNLDHKTGKELKMRKENHSGQTQSCSTNTKSFYEESSRNSKTYQEDKNILMHQLQEKVKFLENEALDKDNTNDRLQQELIKLKQEIQQNKLDNKDLKDQVDVQKKDFEKLKRQYILLEKQNQLQLKDDKQILEDNQKEINIINEERQKLLNLNISTAQNQIQQQVELDEHNKLKFRFQLIQQRLNEAQQQNRNHQNYLSYDNIENQMNFLFRLIGKQLQNNKSKAEYEQIQSSILKLSELWLAKLQETLAQHELYIMI